MAEGQRGRQGLHQSRYQAREGGRRVTPLKIINFQLLYDILDDNIKSFALESMNRCLDRKIHLLKVEGQHFDMTILPIEQYLDRFTI